MEENGGINRVNMAEGGRDGEEEGGEEEGWGGA